jgi:hypothetical protein
VEKLLGERKSPPIIKIQYPLTKQQQPIHQNSPPPPPSKKTIKSPSQSSSKSEIWGFKRKDH